LPVTISIKQRTTAAVPGSGDKLRISIGDVTGGQVMTSLVDANGTALAGPISLRAGMSQEFKFDGQSFTLTLDELSNALIGDDKAKFTVTQQGLNRLGEQQKIERLIEIVRNSEGTKFIRNGAEHTPEQAADHLRSKWQAAGQIATAEQFIDKIASKSSLSGEPYKIRRADGTLVPAGDFLRERLQEMK
jgi:hypothetical protein